MNDPVLCERDGALLLLTLNDPSRANSLSPPLVSALADELVRAASDPGVRAVILTGAGKHFSAGADLAALQQVASGGEPQANEEDSQRFERLFAALLGHPKLTVAAVRGAAVAGGCGLATACDLVVAERSARLSYTEVKIGFIPALVSTFLTRRVAGHVARRLLLDPEMMSAEQAEAVGLVDRVVDDGQALDEARAWAEAVARKASPSALAATKKLLNDTVGLSWREALRIAARANVEQRSRDECRAGVQTFLERKTTPDWLEDEPV